MSPISPSEEKQDLTFIPSPATNVNHVENEYKSENKDYNDEYEIFNKYNDSHKKDLPRFQSEENEGRILSDQIDDN